MKLKITITMDNAAFEGCNGWEVARLLSECLADKVRGVQLAPKDHIALIDINGNKVGEAKVTR